MHQILVYADSLSWGIVPGTRNRFAFADRWPGVMESGLLQRGHEVRVIEDCLNGRRTIGEDPVKDGRNGLVGLEQRIEINSPLALVILLLGTNDFQSMHTNDAWHSAQGLRSLVHAIRQAPIEPGMPFPRIMLVAPPALQVARGEIAAKFHGAEIKAIGLNAAIKEVACSESCEFFDAGDVTTTSKVDGVHLDKDQHHSLGIALTRQVSVMLDSIGSADDSMEIG